MLIYSMDVEFVRNVLNYCRFAERHDDADTAFARESDKVAVCAQRRFRHAVALEHETAEFLFQLRLDVFAKSSGSGEQDAQ